MENNKVLDKCYVVYDEIAKKYIGCNNVNIYSKKPIYSDVPTETYKDIKFAKEFIFKHETLTNKLVIFEIDLLEAQSKKCFILYSKWNANKSNEENFSWFYILL